MSKRFTELEHMIMTNVATDVVQTQAVERGVDVFAKYAFEVKADATFYDHELEAIIQVPKMYVGFWVMRDTSQLMYVTFPEAVQRGSWLKCTKKEVTAFEYIPIA